MAKVIKISDSDKLVPTEQYPYAKWEFKEFNPVQSRLFEIYDNGSNVCVAAATSAGKTICCEMYLAHEIRKRGGKGIYVGPLKALAKEKEQEWSSETHHFGDLKTFIATGDFRFTASRIKEMEESDLVVLTPEMLASRCRNHNSDKSKFLQDCGTIVFDESHLLTVPNRGDHIEVALMKLTEINRNIRVVFLSATMPNVDEICGWITKITGRDTYYLESDYRPCPLSIHYESYYDGDKTYDEKEIQKVGTSCAIVEHYDDDKFLIFTHTKRTGQLMVETLMRHGIKSEFHNADLNLKDRMKLEDKFKNDKSFRVLVATSTLAWGINSPARRVIVAGVHRGLQPVENYDIQQMVGRAGRPKYDPRGDAYVLVPESEKSIWIPHLKTKSPIKSTLLNYVGTDSNPHYKTLAFHIVSEINQGNVKTKEAFKEWSKYSLAHFQDHDFNDAVIEKTLGMLEKCKAIYIDANGEYKCSVIGKVASMFYYSPFDVSDLRNNFKKLFEDKMEDNDFAISQALANIDSYKFAICNKQEKEAIVQYKIKMDQIYGKDNILLPVCKYGCTYYNMMKGKRDVPVLQALVGTLLFDFDRTLQVINSLDTMSSNWNKSSFFKNLGLRVRYGVEADLVELCQIPNVGAVRARKLRDHKIKTLADFVKCDAKTLSNIMRCNETLVKDCLEAAKTMELKSSIFMD